MKIGRRLAAVIVGLTLLQPRAVLADAACDRHDADAHQAVSVAPHSHGDMVSHGTDAPAAREQSCELPPRADCCQALASCGTDHGIVAAERVTALPDEHRQALSSGMTRPLSFLDAPEPPPPRA